MMYIHYCKKCNAIHILSGHKPNCPACSSPLHELQISFAEYSSLSAAQRMQLLQYYSALFLI